MNNKKAIILLLVAVLFLSATVGTVAGFWAGRASLDSSPFLQSLNKRLFKGAFEKVPNQNPSAVSVTTSENIVGVVAKASPAVVSIIVSKEMPVGGLNNVEWQGWSDMFRQFFGEDLLPPEQMQQKQGSEKREIGGGSGFIVSADGYVVTNKHVVYDETADYTVVLNDNSRHEAKVLARDPANDLALLKIEAKDLPTLPLGQSANLQVGQSVIAIGNALSEFRNTVSTGVISGLSRSITAGGVGLGAEKLFGLIQTDASINPGNSGGPLLNLAGEVIGLNVAIAQGAQNIGFAIPIDQIKNSIDSVKRDGKIIRPWLGIRYVMLDKTIAQDNKLPVDYGALIARGDRRTDLAVIPGSPAAKAGLKEDDIILEVNGQKLTAEQNLVAIIGDFKVGAEIKLKIWRQGETKDIKVKLEEMK